MSLLMIYNALATSRGPVYTLSGTSGAPNLALHEESFPVDAHAGWRFRTNGRVEKRVSTYSAFQTGTEWTNEDPSPSVDIWIRGTSHLGNVPAGPAMNVWHKLAGSGSANVDWEWDELGTGADDGTIKVELSTDSSGTPIVATGYYRGVAFVEL